MPETDFVKPAFPALNRQAQVRFWLIYWWWFFVLLPWMLVRQLGITAVDLWFAFRTSGKTWSFLDGRLRLGFVGCGELLVTAGMFGERFTWLRWDGLLIDPGPASSRATVRRHLEAQQDPPVAVACTHWHEEHLGNAAYFADQYAIPVFAAPATLAALRNPPTLPGGRYLLMGQAAQAVGTDLRQLGDRVAGLEVIAADGHCRDHVVLFARDEGVLFAGDAFLDEIFTSPNADTDHQAWIATLERLSELPIRTLVGAHGVIITCDPRLPRIAGVVHTGDPVAMIGRKLGFLRWCLRPALLVPSALASCCLLAVALAPAYPWPLIAMPLVWLVAGILYAGVCLPPGDLATATRALLAIARYPWPFLRRQAIFVVGFLLSTGMVYLLAGLWWAVMASFGGGWFTSTTGWLSLPAGIYALGYTTANLKSLQIWLHLHRDRP